MPETDFIFCVTTSAVLFYFGFTIYYYQIFKALVEMYVCTRMFSGFLFIISGSIIDREINMEH